MYLIHSLVTWFFARRRTNQIHGGLTQPTSTLGTPYLSQLWTRVGQSTSMCETCRNEDSQCDAKRSNLQPIVGQCIYAHVGVIANISGSGIRLSSSNKKCTPNHYDKRFLVKKWHSRNPNFLKKSESLAARWCRWWRWRWWWWCWWRWSWWRAPRPVIACVGGS